MAGIGVISFAIRRKLLINPGEAETVRRTFRRYVALGSVRRLKEELDRDGVLSKTRTGRMAERCGGRPFSRGALYQLLSNPLYIGQVRHRGVNNPGQHQAIIDLDLWARAQLQLKQGGSAPRPRRAKVEASPLAGKLFDESGERLTPTHAVKNGRRYRYYVSRHLVTGTKGQGQPDWRLPAIEIERAVAAAASEILSDRSALVTAMRNADVRPSEIEHALASASHLRENLLTDIDLLAPFEAVVGRVELRADEMVVTLMPQSLLSQPPLSSFPVIMRRVPMQKCRRGQETRLTIENAGALASKPDMTLLKIIARAIEWFEDFVAGRSLADIASREQVTDRYVGRILPLALLAPKIVEAIFEGRQPPHMTAKSLIARATRLPLEWGQQFAL